MRVTLEDLGHKFPRQPFLFRGLTMSLQAGRVYALVGPSGSGKSTLLSILTGWLKPTEGIVCFESVERVGWVFQNPNGVPYRTAIDHVMLPFLVRGLSRTQALPEAMKLMSEFSLAEVTGREFSALSGGEAQRLMLARGLAAQPHLFLVDEPTAQLDTQTAQTVNSSLNALTRDQTIVVVATHDQHTRDACTDVIDLEAYI